jgi:hypothetical protein
MKKAPGTTRVSGLAPALRNNDWLFLNDGACDDFNAKYNFWQKRHYPTKANPPDTINSIKRCLHSLRSVDMSSVAKRSRDTFYVVIQIPERYLGLFNDLHCY